jgi:uncharacterized membrane-anchored protein
MKRLNIRLTLFVLFAVVSVAAPLSIIWKYENTLRHGTLYKFRTKPVDPYDAFRGRYVTLAFADDFIERIQQGENGGELKQEQYSYNRTPLYVRIAADGEGFAKPVTASLTPLAGDDVITVDRFWASSVTKHDKQKNEMVSAGWTLTYPFDRYYLPEDMAPEAEKLYTKGNRSAGGSADDGESARENSSYVSVRVRNGVGVLEELYIGGKPVREALRAELGKK